MPTSRPVPDMWQTIPFERTIVGVARTVTSVTRLLDALELLRADPRVFVVFAFDRRSVFNEGVSDLLHSVGAAMVPWDAVDDLDCDLIISASENIDHAPAGVPILVLPHGVGFHKMIPTTDPDRPRLSGLVPELLVRDRSLVLAVSHQDQVAQLLGIAPWIAGHMVVSGDLAFEQLIASRHLRHRYRRSLRCTDGRTLILLSSTWGTRSQFGSWNGLAARLAAELPVDTYAIAQVLHPNIWASLGGYQVRSLLTDALDAGVALVAPEQGWQAALVAADLVIGDHGSVTFYAAAMDKPVLLADFGEDEIADGTPMAALGKAMPRLRRRSGLLPQITNALNEYQPNLYAPITGRALLQTESTGHLLRQTMYDLLKLTAPDRSAPLRAAPVPQVDFREVDSYVVHSEVAQVAGATVVTLRRYPATLENGGVSSEAPDSVRHLIASAEEPDRRVIQSAAVVADEETASGSEALALESLEATLVQYPACIMAAAAVPGGCVVRVQEDARYVALSDARSDMRLPSQGTNTASILGSTAYALLRAGLLYETSSVVVSIGNRSLHVDLRVRADNRS